MKDQKRLTRLHRRSVLRNTSILALMLAFGGNAHIALAEKAPAPPARALHTDDFEALAGQTFLVHMEGEKPLSVRLDHVKNLAKQHAGTRKLAHPDQEWFSLAFAGPKGQVFPQGTYRLSHPRLGVFDLFLVPTMPAAHEERHIAIINRI